MTSCLDQLNCLSPTRCTTNFKNLLNSNIIHLSKSCPQKELLNRGLSFNPTPCVGAWGMPTLSMHNSNLETIWATYLPHSIDHSPICPLGNHFCWPFHNLSSHSSNKITNFCLPNRSYCRESWQPQRCFYTFPCVLVLELHHRHRNKMATIHSDADFRKRKYIYNPNPNPNHGVWWADSPDDSRVHHWLSVLKLRKFISNPQ